MFLYAQNDTSDFYKRLEKRADKHKVTSWMYDAFFTDLGHVSQADTIAILPKDKTVNQFLKYKGKIVRNIIIKTLDPFGYSVNDTSDKNITRLEKLGNKYHMKTRNYVVRNILQFKPKKELDPLELSESERLLRLSPYVNDARIYIKTLKNRNHSESDSVDVIVVVHDKWSTLAGSRLDPEKPDIQLIERNLFGIGHQLEEDIEWDRSSSYIGTAGRYSIFNIRKTFISSSVFYSHLSDLSQVGFSIDRPFYSSLAKWAGGVAMSRSYDTYIVTDPETEEESRYDLNYNTEDVWAAKNFHFTDKKSSSINRRTKSFTIGSRYFNRDFLTRPSFAIDTNRINRDQQMYLVNAGISQRKFYRDRYLYRFGANEDIPEGFVIEATQGMLQRELASLWYYSGLRLASGARYNFGYLSGGIGYGTFYNKTFMGSEVFSADGFYFSDLIKGGRWFFRGFSRVQLVNGIARQSYENINLNGIQMYGFSSDVLLNKCKLVANLEFVMYAPYEVLGFKFAPVLLFGIGRIGDGLAGMADSRLYQAYALGLLIRNEHLVTNTFEISIGLYPFMPGFSDNTVKFNPVGSYTFKTRDYLISKPDIIPYQ